MPRGASDIPELRLTTLQKFIEKLAAPPNLLFTNMFKDTQYPSSSIKWESQSGSRGMTPFSPTDAPAHVIEPHGVAQHQAEAAYWKEKMGFGEEWLNNIRKEGTYQEYVTAKKRLSREMQQLQNRCMRRKEWMYAQMICNNGFSYSLQGGYKASIDYGIPEDHRVTLGADYKWTTGTSKDILGDITDAKQTVNVDCGSYVEYAICNSQMMNVLAQDETIRSLLAKDKWGDGDLYKGTRHPILGINTNAVSSLLDIPKVIIYDETYEVRAWLTSSVTGGSTTSFTVSDASQYEAGDSIRFYNPDNRVYEDAEISAVDIEAGQITLTGTTTNSFLPMRHYISARKFFIPENMFVMFTTKVDNQDIAEFAQAPFGLNRQYGTQVDEKEEWDPDAVWIRIQDKGLPILYFEDSIYTITAW